MDSFRPYLKYIIIFLSLAGLYFTVVSDLAVLWKFFISIAQLYITGKILIKYTDIKGDSSLILLRTQKGINQIKSLAKHERFWNLFADLGMVLSYGLSSFFFIHRPAGKKIPIIIAGLLLLVFFATVLSPFVYPSLTSILDLGLTTHKTDASPLAFLGFPMILLGGFALLVTLAIVGYGASILLVIFRTLFYGTGEMATTAPGATLLLPGVNLPFVEGILALMVILLVHEGAHAVLAVLGRVRLLSSGIVLFGSLPIGAFIEPDEKQLAKKPDYIQSRVLVAGSTSNFLASLFFFALLFSFLFIAEPFREEGILVVSGLEHNDTIVYSINGQPVDGEINISVQPNTEVILTTNYGEIKKQTNEEGKLGILYLSLSSPVYYIFNSPILSFIKSFLLLTFALNFIVGVVNLLPLPFFDGYRLLELNLKNKSIVTGIAVVVVISFLLNFAPWFF
ncbi:site-2 protease family protein [Candidatus Micrarchaeota archaeon]|nr:site-2 protease family protein [Candidatus Micrarchaeota archaeon]